MPRKSVNPLENEALCVTDQAKARAFPSGAIRNSEAGKLDYDGFLSPPVLRRYAQYMDRQRKLEDGSFRASDDWQRGIPCDSYMRSLWRHFMDVWTLHRGHKASAVIEDALCAVIFNAMGYLHEVLRNANSGRKTS